MILITVAAKPNDLLKIGTSIRVNSMGDKCILAEQSSGEIITVYDATISISDTIIVAGQVYPDGKKVNFIGHFDSKKD